MVYPVIIPLVVAGSSQATDIADELIAVATRLVGSVGAENVNRLIDKLVGTSFKNHEIC